MQCRALVDFSDKIGDGWELRESGDEIYIVKKVKLPIQFREETTSESVLTPESDDEDEMVQEHPETNSFASNAHLITFEYHVTYSCSYSVPVLYFLAWHSTGQLLTVEEVWKIAPPCDDTYSYITQIDHPVLARPFFELHPCRTEQLMALTQTDKHRYLVSWLSSLGRDVGLSLDIRYAMLETL